MRRTFLALALATAPAHAQYFSSPPAVLTNGTTAFASQVMLDLNRIISDGNTAYASVAAAIAGFTPLTVPAGMVLPFNLSTCPGGWVESNGSGGTVDLRGYFVRVWNSGGGPYDAGRVRNSTQTELYASHLHDLGGTVAIGLTGTTAHTSNIGSPYLTSIGSTSGTSSAVSGSFGTETRPINIALLFCQKT